MKLFKKILSIIKDKYILTSLVFLFGIIVFDKNNLVDRYKKLRELSQLEKDKIYYQEWIEDDKKRMEELKTSDETLEKFAREQYYMKEENEEIFVIMEE